MKKEFKKKIKSPKKKMKFLYCQYTSFSFGHIALTMSDYIHRWKHFSDLAHVPWIKGFSFWSHDASTFSTIFMQWPIFHKWWLMKVELFFKFTSLSMVVSDCLLIVVQYNFKSFNKKRSTICLQQHSQVHGMVD
jgi:hypothetical protein